MKNSGRLVILAVAFVAIITVGCAKKKVAAKPPTPPTPTVTAAQPERSAAQPTRTANASPTMQKPAEHPTRYPSAQTRARIDTLLGRIEDAYFDYDRHSLRPDAIKTLEGDSGELRDLLKDYPDYELTIEGYCDERGSAEYNLGLGQERAQASKDYLVQVGIPARQLSTVSYGKEKPICQDQNEGCWQKNRRIHIVALAQK